MQNENISPDIKRMCKTPAEKKCARRGDQNSCLLMQNLLACMHNDYNHFFSAAVLFCCFSVAVEWVSEWTCFSTVCSFFVWHTRKKTGPVFWSLCAICKVVPIYTRFFSLETSTQFKFGFGWFFFCRLVRRHKMPLEAEGKTHFEWSVHSVHSIAVIGLLTRSIKWTHSWSINDGHKICAHGIISTFNLQINTWIASWMSSICMKIIEKKNRGSKTNQNKFKYKKLFRLRIW